MTVINTDKHDYELVQDWGRLPEDWSFGVVSSVATDSQDQVYVYQRKDPPIVVFDSDGNYLNSWGTSAFNLPHGFCIVDDIVYLTDREDFHHGRFIPLIHGKTITYPNHLAQLFFMPILGPVTMLGVPWGKQTGIVWMLT